VAVAVVAASNIVAPQQCLEVNPVWRIPVEEEVPEVDLTEQEPAEAAVDLVS
jgi:hypothetical protein